MFLCSVTKDTGTGSLSSLSPLRMDLYIHAPTTRTSFLTLPHTFQPVLPAMPPFSCTAFLLSEAVDSWSWNLVADSLFLVGDPFSFLLRATILMS